MRDVRGCGVCWEEGGRVRDVRSRPEAIVLA